ncbi:MAG: acylneuraminate cytidylyltransferase family protein [Planctomycetota bacterium]
MPDDTIAIILGRAGSKGLPGKNAHDLNGRPTVSYTIDHAIAASTVDRVIVSTDDPAIADAARTMQVDVIDRPAELATDQATVADATRHALRASGSTADVVVVLYANVPVRPADLIDRAVTTLRSTGADSVQSYVRMGKHHPYWMVHLRDEGRIEQFIENSIDRRQDLPPLWLPDGGVAAIQRRWVDDDTVAPPHGFLGIDRRGIETREGDVVDIDSALDRDVAAALLRRREIPA